jgi:hypothetical protein
MNVYGTAACPTPRGISWALITKDWTMLRLIAAATLLLAATPAMAQTSWNSNQVGPYTYYNGTDSQGGAWSGRSQQLGPFRYDNFSGPNGQTSTCTSQRLGNQTYTHCN